MAFHRGRRCDSSLYIRAGPGIMALMKTLVETNIYLRNPRLRRKMLAQNALESSIFEGAESLRVGKSEKTAVHVIRRKARSRLSKASAKKAVKGS